MNSDSYKLRSTLSGHELDVRGISALSNDAIVSGSRDGTARVWDMKFQLDINTNNEVCFLSPTGSFVNAVEAVSSNLTGPLVAIGGKDAVIYLSEPHDSFTKSGDDFGKFQLVGHQGNVCSLNYKDDVLVSGSWDCTAKVWDLNLFSVKHDLVGHMASVWDAKVVDAANEIYLTCSADRTIRKWQGNVEIARFTGHNDVIRKLLVLPGGKQFVSASNDCTLKVWDLESGAVLHTLEGHDSFIYDIGILSNGDIVSTAEDRSIRVWRNGKVFQAITLPCISVWCVTVLPNDDIAVGGSDKHAYVFTKDDARAATADAIAQFKSLVQESAISEQSLDDLKKTDIPGYDRLQQPGKEEGSTVMVKSPTGVIEAHQWSGGEWVKIGDVVSSAAGTSGKKEYLGKEWDYVFDVDIEDGKPPLKLPYNSNENPYIAADKFLVDNELPASYREEVVKFIEQNTGGFLLEQQLALEPTAAPASAPTAPGAPKGLSLLPQKTPITFKDYTAAQLIKGFSKFNSAQTGASSFSAADVATVESSLQDLKSKQALHLITSVIPKILSSWAPAEKLVGYDLLRISIPRVTTVDLIQSTDAAENILKMLLQSLGEIGEQDLPLVMMIAKVLCNLTTSALFVQLFFTVNDNNSVELNEYFVDFVHKLTVVIKVITTSSVSESHKHFSTAMSSIAAFLYNLSAYAFTNKSVASNPSSLRGIATFLEDIGEDLVRADEEAAYRLCVALGNLLVAKVTDSTPQWYGVSEQLYTSSRFQEVYSDIEKA